jgi:hypothetical protein
VPPNLAHRRTTLFTICTTEQPTDQKQNKTKEKQRRKAKAKQNKVKPKQNKQKKGPV